MAKIIGIGNALVDILLQLDNETMLQELKLAKGGMTLINTAEWEGINARIGSLPKHRATGGSAANTVLALALLGDEPGLVGCIGQDELGAYLRQQAQDRHIDARFVQTSLGRTGVATTFITPDGERTFATHLGAAAMLTPAMIQPATFDGYDVLHVEGYLVQDHSLMEHILHTAKAAGLQVSYDLASYNVVRDDHDFIVRMVTDYVDIIFANREEAAAFSRQDDPEAALEQLAGLTTTAIVKLGSKGAIGMVRRGDGSTHRAEAPLRSRVKVIDTTAAGDFFAAGFLHGLTHAADLDTCLDFGNRIAAEVIQVMGTQVTAGRLREAIGV